MPTRYQLGRKPSPVDERDYKMADYADRVLAARQAVGIAEPWYSRLWTSIIRWKTWRDWAFLDQGATPHCVGFGWAGWSDCLPVMGDYTDIDAHRIYYECKLIDGEPGVENGSYVRSGAKAMKNRGRLTTYYFASSVEEAADYVRRVGPVVLGIDWYAGMYEPTAFGVIKPTGSLEGGHCILWRGVQGCYALLRNSWGKDWGVKGDCRITLRNLKYLFANWGEACAATELPL